jgi:hypothetical protein
MYVCPPHSRYLLLITKVFIVHLHKVKIRTLQSNFYLPFVKFYHIKGTVLQVYKTLGTFLKIEHTLVLRKCQYI